MVTANKYLPQLSFITPPAMTRLSTCYQTIQRFILLLFKMKKNSGGGVWYAGIQWKISLFDKVGLDDSEKDFKTRESIGD